MFSKKIFLRPDYNQTEKEVKFVRLFSLFINQMAQ
jgi:hypothetical protein